MTKLGFEMKKIILCCSLLQMFTLNEAMTSGFSNDLDNDMTEKFQQMTLMMPVCFKGESDTNQVLTFLNKYGDYIKPQAVLYFLGCVSDKREILALQYQPFVDGLISWIDAQNFSADIYVDALVDATEKQFLGIVQSLEKLYNHWPERFSLEGFDQKMEALRERKLQCWNNNWNNYLDSSVDREIAEQMYSDAQEIYTSYATMLSPNRMVSLNNERSAFFSKYKVSTFDELAIAIRSDKDSFYDVSESMINALYPTRDFKEEFVYLTQYINFLRNSVRYQVLIDYPSDCYLFNDPASSGILNLLKKRRLFFSENGVTSLEELDALAFNDTGRSLEEGSPRFKLLESLSVRAGPVSTLRLPPSWELRSSSILAAEGFEQHGGSKGSISWRPKKH